MEIYQKNGDRLMQGITLKQLADICLAGTGCLCFKANELRWT